MVVASLGGSRVAGLAVCIAGCLILALELAPDGHAGLYAVVGRARRGVLAVALAVLFVRVPWAVAPLALACVPSAWRWTSAQSHGRLLVPLYAVVAGAALALLWRPRPRSASSASSRGRSGSSSAWAGVSLLWSDDPRAGATMLVLFVLPLGVLALALARVPWRTGWAGALGDRADRARRSGSRSQAACSTLTRDVSVEVDETFVSGWYYRVGPVFDDPGDYAAFLASRSSWRSPSPCASRDVRCLGPGRSWPRSCSGSGSCPSFSQTRASPRSARPRSRCSSAVWSPRALVPAALPWRSSSARSRRARSRSLRTTSSVPPGGGAASVHGAIRVARDHPLAGVGLGAARRGERRRDASPPSSGSRACCSSRRSSQRGARGGTSRHAEHRVRSPSAWRCSSLAVDSAFRGSLLRDPLFWGALGLIAAAARRPSAAAR